MSAEQGNLDAQYTIAVMYDGGLGVEQDFAIAFTWYKLAADQGFGPAIDALNELYSE